jgi:hypothetical protein
VAPAPAARDSRLVLGARIVRNALWFGAAWHFLIQLNFSQRFLALPTSVHVAELMAILVVAALFWTIRVPDNVALPFTPTTDSEGSRLIVVVGATLVCVGVRHFLPTGNLLFFGQLAITFWVARRQLGGWRRAAWWTSAAAYAYSLPDTSFVVLLLGVGAVAAFLASAILSPRYQQLLVEVVALAVAASGIFAAALYAVGLPFGVAALVLAALVVSPVLLARHWARPTSGVRRFGRLVGLVAVAAGSAAVVGATFFLWASLSGYINRALLDEGDLHYAPSGDAPLPPVTVARPGRLAVTYSPFMVFTGDERWGPSRVQPFLNDALVLEPDGSIESATDILTASSHASLACRAARQCKLMLVECRARDESGACSPGECHSAACARPCRFSSLACAAPRAEETADPVVYAHVVRDPLRKAGVAPGDRRALPKPLRDLQVIVQYWAFYRYDDWHAWPFEEFRQWHDGDWESVSIGFSATEPLFAAFSSHCGGTWLPWGNIETTPTIADANGRLEAAPPDSPRATSHLVVYVGRGSHAMYPVPTPRAPDWATCKKWNALTWVATWGPSQSLAVTETMPSAGSNVSVGPRPIPVGKTTAWLKYQGWWSAGDHMAILPRLPKGSHDCAAACSGGPDAPSAKPEWHDPIGVIFCGRRWRPRTRARILQRLVGRGVGGCHSVPKRGD